MFKKKTLKFVIISPSFNDKMAEDINNMIYAFKKKGLSIDLEKVEEKLPFKAEAKHFHVVGECFGTLEIDEKGIKYESVDGEHKFRFYYGDIKSISRSNPRELELVIFKRSMKKMWKSEKFKFKLLKNKIIPDDIFLYVRYRIERED